MTRTLTTLTAALALSTLSIGAAHATLIPVVLTIPSSPGDTSMMTGSFTDAIAAGGAFTDDIVFAGPPPSSTITFVATPGDGLSFTIASFSYFSGGGTVPFVIGYNGSTISGGSIGPVISALYDLKISGIAAAGSSYSGTISATVGTPIGAVPEPGSWALMLLGLGATGAFVGTRKRRHA